MAWGKSSKRSSKGSSIAGCGGWFSLLDVLGDIWTKALVALGLFRFDAGISLHSSSPTAPALFGEGNRTRRVGLGVGSSSSIGTCFVPRKRPGDDCIARCRAATAVGASEASDLVSMMNVVSALIALCLFIGGNSGSSSFSGSPEDSSAAPSRGEEADSVVAACDVPF